jgi:hypothetical protein
MAIDNVVRELIDRIEKLERGTVSMKQLPITNLRNRILFDEPQDPTRLILPRSVVTELIAEENINEGHLDSELKTKLGI